jgi:hypothetical protein
MRWLTHMKTTVEIAEDLFARTREVAQREGTTLRALIEEGLQAALARGRLDGAGEDGAT